MELQMEFLIQDGSLNLNREAHNLWSKKQFKTPVKKYDFDKDLRIYINVNDPTHSQ